MKDEDPYWSEEVTAGEAYHTPPGTFTQPAPEVVKVLLGGADGKAELALRRLVFYMNRAGDKLANKAELEKAKEKLEELEIRQKRNV